MASFDELFRFSRRDVLRTTGAGLLVVGGGSVLTSCSDSATDPSGTTGSPTRGGTLRLGASGGGAGDTLDAQNLLTNADYARCYALYDPLFKVDAEGAIQNVLAESIEPNASATVWTIRVRGGVTCHDGKPFGAKDVLFSLNRIVSNNLPGSTLLQSLDLKSAKLRDERTLSLPCTGPFGLMKEVLANFYMFMVPEGYDVKNPVGTGPFKFESFTAGQESTFVRFDDYWQDGKPYLDELIITNFADETSQVNAFSAGQVDAINYLSAPSIPSVEAAGGRAVIAESAAFGPFTMRVDTEPYSDVRVRTALKLVVDRPQMIEEVYGGYGRLGNDVWGIADPLYDSDLPQRVQDLDQAKSLLSSAGHSDLQVQLITTSAFPGSVQAAQVFAVHAADAGVDVKVEQQDPTQYFANSYLNVPFSQDYFPYVPYLVDAMYATLKTAPFNSTHFNSPEYDALFAQALKTTSDNDTRRSIAHDMMKIDHEEGGFCIPYFLPIIDGVSNRVQGVNPSVTGVALGGFDWANVWMES